MPFDMKAFLDREVVPVLGEGDTKLSIYSFVWNGDPPKDVLVFLLGPELAWGTHVKRLLEAGWRFDYLREQVAVVIDRQVVPIFGGDGAPIFSKAGTASVRLFKKLDDGTCLIVQIGTKCKDGIDAAATVKGFFGLFGENAIQICQTYAAPFGQA